MRHLFDVVRDVNGPPGSWLGGAGKAGAIGAAGTETRSARKTASPGRGWRQRDQITPRRNLSSSMDANRALKLPSP
ncbi:hypothetical protein, partial [Pseudomonas aeruginosa]